MGKVMGVGVGEGVGVGIAVGVDVGLGVGVRVLPVAEGIKKVRYVYVPRRSITRTRTAMITRFRLEKFMALLLHLPIQNSLKIRSRRSSLAVSPVTSPRSSYAARKSIETKSNGNDCVSETSEVRKCSVARRNAS